jgi:8-oxo-dGTP pyrophosphatase MutT (NUDIX family)
VSAICFTEHRKIVLVSGEGQRWDMPGGRPEHAESLEDALAREVWEQACARVVRSQYIGCERVEDPNYPDGPRTYYQARFWARVEVYPFKAQFETTERRLIDTDSFLATLFWAESPIAQIILERGIAVENRNGGACL